MKAIVAVDKNWAIGYKKKLLVSIPSDMRNFRQTTKNHIVVMGRKTLESFPQGQPLSLRTNVVLTRDPMYKVKDAIVVHSLKELKEELENYDSDEVFVIGGGSVYELLLPYCDTVLVTKVDFAYQADTYFPNLDKLPEWELTEEGEEQTCFDIDFQFTKYERIG